MAPLVNGDWSNSLRNVRTGTVKNVECYIQANKSFYLPDADCQRYRFLEQFTHSSQNSATVRHCQKLTSASDIYRRPSAFPEGRHRPEGSSWVPG